MMGLSHGAIRVDTGEKLSVLTLQDVGTPMPGGRQSVGKNSQLSQNHLINRKNRFGLNLYWGFFMPPPTEILCRSTFVQFKQIIFVSVSALMCVVKLEGVPQLCKTDEIGEICVSSIATGTSYYGLTGMSKNTFEVGNFSHFSLPKAINTTRSFHRSAL